MECCIFVGLNNSQVAELVDAKITSGQRAIGEGPRKLRIQVRILSWLQIKNKTYEKYNNIAIDDDNHVLIFTNG